jgi:two-component system cell cycle response regulator CtrA
MTGQSRIQQLEDQVEVLKDALADRTVPLPDDWPLSPMEETVFRVMLKRDVARFAAIFAALYSDRPDPPDDKIIHVFIFRIRRKLKPFGVVVTRVRHVGYALDAVTRARFKDQEQKAA